MLTSEASQATPSQQDAIPTLSEQEKQQSVDQRTTRKLARSTYRTKPAYDRVKDILCRFAQVLAEEEQYEQHAPFQNTGGNAQGGNTAAGAESTPDE